MVADSPKPPTKGFDTSCHAIGAMIDALVRVIEKRPNELGAVVRNLNRPHGIEPRLRLVILHGYNEQADELVEEIESKMLSQVVD